jgi:hypothetical protein
LPEQELSRTNQSMDIKYPLHAILRIAQPIKGFLRSSSALPVDNAQLTL